MSLWKQLRTLGTKLGILHFEKPRDVHAPTKIVMRTISIAELEIEVVAESSTPEQINLTNNFTTIGETHGITIPAHGWTIERLAQESNLTGNNSNDRTAIQIALLERLHGEKVPTEDLVRDAITRDQAVDAYAATMRHRLILRAQDRIQRKLEIQQEMDRLTNEQQQLVTDEAADNKNWQQWWNQKLEYEHKIASAVSYLLEKPIISIDAQVPSIDASAKSTEQKSPRS